MLLARRAHSARPSIGERQRLHVTRGARLCPVAREASVVEEPASRIGLGTLSSACLPAPEAERRGAAVPSGTDREADWPGAATSLPGGPGMTAWATGACETYFCALSRRSITIDSSVFSDVAKAVGLGSLPPFST